jgi:NAD(P)-dependent dehydrogenase (short-subunit alcohol dehydrogenase family)
MAEAPDVKPGAMSGRIPESDGKAPGRGRLKGRRILIVGGGQRIFDAATDPTGNGRAMSILCAREGAHVAVADLNRTAAEHTVMRITAEGGRAFTIQADVTRENDVARMIDEAQQAMGGLDGMVLNVGTFGKTGLDSVSAEQWNYIYDVNVRGPMFCCREALDKFENGGSIVFISSIAALEGRLADGGLRFLQGRARGLMRNIAHPARTRHPRQSGLSRAGRYAERPVPPRGPASRGKGGNTPFGRQSHRMGDCHAVLFFLSDESVYITAQTLAVDSGLSGL